MARFTPQSLHLRELFQEYATQAYDMDDYDIRAVEIWLAGTYGTFGTTYYSEMLPAELASPLFCLEMYRLG